MNTNFTGGQTCVYFREQAGLRSDHSLPILTSKRKTQMPALPTPSLTRKLDQSISQKQNNSQFIFRYAPHLRRRTFNHLAGVLLEAGNFRSPALSLCCAYA